MVATPFAVEPAQNKRVRTDRRSGARISHTAGRVDEGVTVLDDGDLQPDLRLRADQLVEQSVDRHSEVLFAHVGSDCPREPHSSVLVRLLEPTPPHRESINLLGEQRTPAAGRAPPRAVSGMPSPARRRARERGP